ncbi:MAG: 2-phosphosulfolactate phosphatase [Elusimicrobia bacterium]|nr:2-phosphosulfolactate phosphatase [Elusimicrobiota bacterium]
MSITSLPKNCKSSKTGNRRPCKISAATSARTCRTWTGTAVVVDVLRSSTTLCALLASGKKKIRVFGDKKAALAAKTRRDEFFSELDYPPSFRRFDNSPWQALNQSDRKRPAIVVTGAGTKAQLSLKKASRVLAACFANFPVAVEYIRGLEGKVLVVPAALFNEYHVEDYLCAEAIVKAAKGEKNAARRAIKRFMATKRPAEFLNIRKKNGKNDMALALDLGSLAVLPEITLEDDHGVVTDAL